MSKEEVPNIHTFTHQQHAIMTITISLFNFLCRHTKDCTLFKSIARSPFIGNPWVQNLLAALHNKTISVGFVVCAVSYKMRSFFSPREQAEVIYLRMLKGTQKAFHTPRKNRIFLKPLKDFLCIIVLRTL